MNTPEDVLKTIISALTQYPEAIRIDKTSDEMGVLLNVHLDQTDMGKVIGRGGDTIMSIRKILHAVGMRSKQKISIKIAEPGQN